MTDYKEMYLQLFRAITAAEDKLADVATLLHKAQLACEDIYISADDDEKEKKQ